MFLKEKKEKKEKKAVGKKKYLIKNGFKKLLRH
jgi:hypothetical protein